MNLFKSYFIDSGILGLANVFKVTMKWEGYKLKYKATNCRNLVDFFLKNIDDYKDEVSDLHQTVQICIAL